MGPLFVLLFWGLVAVVVGVPTVAVLLGLARASGGGERAWRVGGWLLRAVFVGGAYGFVALLIYMAACSARGVDPGFGDWWGVPIGSYSFNSLEPNVASIDPGLDGGQALVSGITQLEERGNYVYGVARDMPFFLFDTRDGTLQWKHDREPWLKLLVNRGIADPHLQSADAFYFSKRWSWLDFVLLLALGGPGAFLGFRTFRSAWLGTGAAAQN